MFHTPLKSHMILALLMLMMLFLGFAAARAWQKKIAVQADISRTQKEIEARQRSIDTLEAHLHAFDDPAAREREAKVRLRLRRPDERVVFLVPGIVVAGEEGKENIQTPSASKGIDVVWETLRGWFGFAQ